MSGVRLAESREEAFEHIRVGSARLVPEYFGLTLDNQPPDVPFDKIMDKMLENKQWMVGTSDDCIADIQASQRWPSEIKETLWVHRRAAIQAASDTYEARSGWVKASQTD